MSPRTSTRWSRVSAASASRSPTSSRPPRPSSTAWWPKLLPQSAPQARRGGVAAHATEGAAGEYGGGSGTRPAGGGPGASHAPSVACGDSSPAVSFATLGEQLKPAPMNILITGASAGTAAPAFSLLNRHAHAVIAHSTRGSDRLIAGDLSDPAAPRAIWDTA